MDTCFVPSRALGVPNGPSLSPNLLTPIFILTIFFSLICILHFRCCVYHLHYNLIIFIINVYGMKLWRIGTENCISFSIECKFILHSQTKRNQIEPWELTSNLKWLFVVYFFCSEEVWGCYLSPCTWTPHMSYSPMVQFHS